MNPFLTQDLVVHSRCPRRRRSRVSRCFSISWVRSQDIRSPVSILQSRSPSVRADRGNGSIIEAIVSLTLVPEAYQQAYSVCDITQISPQHGARYSSLTRPYLVSHCGSRFVRAGCGAIAYSTSFSGTVNAQRALLSGPTLT